MDDLHILLAMVEGAVQEAHSAIRRRIGALDLLFRGVAEPGEWTAPGRVDPEPFCPS